MGHITGRPSTGRMKRIGGGLLDGLSAIGTAMSDSPKKERILEIESQIEALSWERSSLISQLIENFGDREPDEDFDSRRPPISYSAPKPALGGGRLTVCGGSWDELDRFKECHPGCPYKGTKHNSHEFTLND